ncbi:MULTISPECIES: DUF1178 family protein [Bartonella]|uniref:DUF1178 family protein n=1 Tax=Bartonella choladocola TaxID=2750995 RepID=A0A1U9MGA2_9HYPH|nr:MULTISPECIES: DUF1178 family protein [Bartonella]AQT46758.1 hypothetical protein BBC0122_006290 [Bartonella choladocola]MBH9974227.1 DUF1178 family protein [Bartonella choladocola]MBI0013834.1 DUF1178 family protein [Bartonella sp. B10834G3]MBI0140117.1 DUF1178 family protein [Bartonella choladocola]
MIRFSLHCDKAHEFDGWFRNNDDFSNQKNSGLIRCPVCDSTNIEKTLMAPAISTSKKHEQVGMGLDPEQKRMIEEMRKLTRQVRKNAEYVGDRFAEEARRIHFKEVKQRPIYGEATGEDVSSLVEDGIPVMPLATLPEDEN